VVAAGFDGLTIDRFGYPDRGAALEGAVGAFAGPPAIVSPDGRESFFDLRAYRTAVDARVGASTLAAARSAVLRPLTMTFGTGFYGPEQDAAHTWHWSRSTATLVVDNPARQPTEAVLEFSAAAGAGSGTLDVNAPRTAPGTVTVALSTTPVPVRVVLDLAPGRNVVRLSSDAAPSPASHIG